MRWRHFSSLLLIAALIGFLMNWGVTWWIAHQWNVHANKKIFWLQDQPGRYVSGVSERTTPTWFVTIHDDDTSIQIGGFQTNPIRPDPDALIVDIPAWSRFSRPPEASDIATISERAHGWPWISARSVVTSSRRVLTSIEAGIQYDISAIPLIGSAETPLTIVQPTMLPTEPVWPGFLYNLLFYSGISWLLLIGCAFIGSRARRYARWRRMRCPQCAYQLIDDESGCSECGWGRNNPSDLDRWQRRGKRRSPRSRSRAHHPRSRWKRLLVRTGVSVLLGLIATFTIAWLSAAFLDVFNPAWKVTHKRGISLDDGWVRIVWYNERPSGHFFGSSLQKSDRANLIDPPPEQVMPRWVSVITLHPSRKELDAVGKRRHFRQFNARGWPWLALYAEYTSHIDESRSRPVYSTQSGGIPLESAPWEAAWATVDRALPYIPIWPGLLFDVAFFGAIWFGFFSAVRVIRMSLRKYLRFCPVCRTDLRGRFGDECPNC